MSEPGCVTLRAGRQNWGCAGALALFLTFDVMILVAVGEARWEALLLLLPIYGALLFACLSLWIRWDGESLTYRSGVDRWTIRFDDISGYEIHKGDGRRSRNPNLTVLVVYRYGGPAMTIRHRAFNKPEQDRLMARLDEAVAQNLQA